MKVLETMLEQDRTGRCGPRYAHVAERQASRVGTVSSRHAGRPKGGRAAAMVSLLLWIAIIFMGRWIGFTTTRVTGSKLDSGVNIEDLLPK